MHQSLFQQEIQGTVDRRGSCRSPIVPQLLENTVGTEGFMALPDNLQYAPAQRGQAYTVIRAHCGGSL